MTLISWIGQPSLMHAIVVPEAIKGSDRNRISDSFASLRGQRDISLATVARHASWALDEPAPFKLGQPLLNRPRTDLRCVNSLLNEITYHLAIDKAEQCACANRSMRSGTAQRNFRRQIADK